MSHIPTYTERFQAEKLRSLVIETTIAKNSLLNGIISRLQKEYKIAAEKLEALRILLDATIVENWDRITGQNHQELSTNIIEIIKLNIKAYSYFSAYWYGKCHYIDDPVVLFRNISVFLQNLVPIDFTESIKNKQKPT